MNLQIQLSKLEATASPAVNGPWHRVIGHSEEEWRVATPRVGGHRAGPGI